MSVSAPTAAPAAPAPRKGMRRLSDGAGTPPPIARIATRMRFGSERVSTESRTPMRAPSAGVANRPKSIPAAPSSSPAAKMRSVISQDGHIGLGISA